MFPVFQTSFLWRNTDFFSSIIYLKNFTCKANPIPAFFITEDDVHMCEVRGLGGKLGDTVVSQLGVETMGQLSALSLRQIAAKFEEKTAQWLHSLGTGG